MELLRDQPRPILIQGEAAMKEMDALLAGAFPVPPGGSFFDDFPVWLEKHSADSVRVGYRAEQELVACAALRIAHVRNGAAIDRIGIIGAVATAESARGQGLASALVEDLVERARKVGARAVVLFSGDTAFYERLGFRIAGQQARVPLAALGLPDAPAGSPIGHGWVPGLMPLLKARDTGLQHQDKDQAWLSAHRNTAWSWIGSPLSPRAWVAVGRGIDLAGMVHEWGGEPDALRQLLGRIAVIGPIFELLGHPSHLERMGFARASELQPDPLCLLRTLDPAFVWETDTWLWGLDGA